MRLPILAYLCLLGACSIGVDSIACVPENEGRTSADPVPRVVLIGSSSAAGAGASADSRSYAGRLASWLAQYAPGSCIQDLAVGGYTTYQLRPSDMGREAGHPGVDSARNVDAALSLSPSLLIIHLPSNDVAAGYPLASSLRNIEAMLDRARSRGVAVAVVGPHPRGFTGGRKDSLARWAAILDTLSRAERIVVWDSLSRDSQSLRPGVRADGVHFNDSGHAIVFRQIVRSRSWARLFGRPDSSIR